MSTMLATLDYTTAKFNYMFLNPETPYYKKILWPVNFLNSVPYLLRVEYMYALLLCRPLAAALR